jgi:hypothetical protein
MFQYDGNTGGFPKLGDYVEVVRSGDRNDGIRGKIGGWGDHDCLIALIALDEPLADGRTIVGWPVVCLKEVRETHEGKWQKAFDAMAQSIDLIVGNEEQELFDSKKNDHKTKPTDFIVDADGYTIWNGGDYRPVDKETIVRVKVRGNIPRDPVRAGSWPQICWMHRHKDDEMNKWDIVAYKVVK